MMTTTGGDERFFHTVKDRHSRYGVNTVDRAVALLEAFDSGKTHSLADLARRTRLSEATALRYLSTLCRHALVERDDVSGRYRLGVYLFQLGQRARDGGPAPRVSLPMMEQLLGHFQETVNLAVRHGDQLIIIDALESTRSIKKGATVGERDNWHCSSLGKAILAFLPEDEIHSILGRRDLQRYTATTLASFQELMPDLGQVRELGYAVDNQESEDGLLCVGAPIFDHHGKPSHAISLSGPANRFTPRLVTEMGRELRMAAASISAALGYTDKLGRDGKASPFPQAGQVPALPG